MLQELEKWAPSYIAALNTVSPNQPVRMLLDACRVPSVVECCGQEGIGATVLGSAVQVALFLCFFIRPLRFPVLFAHFDPHSLQLCSICHVYTTPSSTMGCVGPLSQESLQAAIIAHAIVDG